MATSDEQKRKNEEYWEGRSLQLEESLHNIGSDYFEEVAQQYRKAAANIQKDIDVFYGRFAKENKISYDEAYTILTGKEKEAFAMSLAEYTEKARELPFTGDYISELENASIAHRVTRLQALQLEMRKEADSLMSFYDSGLKKTIGEVYESGYYHQIYEIQKGLGIGVAFDKLDKVKIEAVTSKPWLPDGKNFSERVWGDHRAALVNFLENDFTNSMIRGASRDELAKQLADLLTDEDKGRLYAAKRLLYQEDAYFSSVSIGEAYKSQNLEKYKNIAVLDKKTSEVCKDMDGTVFLVVEYKPGFTAAPFHLWCRTTSSPTFDKDEIDALFEQAERAARGEDGKVYFVPADMTYRMWESYTDAKRNEPGISEFLSKIVSDKGGQMAGLDYRTKTAESFIRKVTTDMSASDLSEKEAISEIYDTIRYTSVTGPENLSQHFSDVVELMKESGYTIVGVKNTWLDDYNPYKGVNVKVESPEGQKFELQFHTQESFDLKNGELHTLYEEARVIDPLSSEYKELQDRMFELSDGLQVPSHIEKVKK